MAKQSLVVFVATHWGSAKGGINVFNTAICKATAEVLAEENVHVVCVCQVASDQDIADGASADVQLLRLEEAGNDQRLTENRYHELINVVEKNCRGTVAWWIGHDVISGEIATRAAKESGAKSAILHHMNYEAYKSISADPKLGTKIAAQAKTLINTDLVFAVGPKLRNSALDKVSRNPDIDVVELIPGLDDVVGIEMPKVFRAVTFGRMEKRTNAIKQASLATAAFAKCQVEPESGLGNDANLQVIGIAGETEKKERKALAKLAFDFAGRAVPINALPYTNNREELLDSLRTHSVCLMLSVHEGFGLTGWEAIASEVPLIVSKNSGIFELLDSIGGPFAGCVRPVSVRGSAPGETSVNEFDVEMVARELQAVAQNPERAKSDARALKLMLQEIFTWQHAATTFVNAIGFQPSPASMADTMSTRWQPHKLIEALSAKNNDIVEQAAKRRKIYSSMKKTLSSDQAASQRLILFGGVASSLCNEDSAKDYAQWLTKNKDAKLLVFYETGEASMARAATLKSSFETSDALPTDPAARMAAKVKLVQQLPSKIQSNVTNEEWKSIANQITMLPTNTPLSTYIIVENLDVSITPLMEQRSSETLTFTLSSSSVEWTTEVIRYMKFNVESTGNSVEADKFLTELEILQIKLIEFNSKSQ